MKNFLKQIFTYEFLLIYLMLLLFSGFYFFEYTTKYSIVIMLMFIFFRRKRWARLNRKCFLQFICMLGIVFLSESVSGFVYKGAPDITLIFVNVLLLIVGYLLANSIDKEKFIEIYVLCMVIISIVSLVAFVIGSIDFSLLTKLPVLHNSNNRAGYFAVFTIVSNFMHSGSHRNQGIFWEPGAFQALLCLAYVFELSKYDKKRKWVLLILLATMFTTFSTTGMVVAVFLTTYTFSQSKGSINSIKAIGMVCLVLVAISFILPNLTGFWKYTIVDKISMVLDYSEGVENASSTRIDSIIYPMREFIKSPLWGIGTSGLVKLYNVTCTPVNIVAQYGIFYGCIVFTGLWKFFRKMFKTRFDTCVMFAIFMLSVMTEAFQTNILMFVLCFLGLLNSKKRYGSANE